MEDIYGCKLRSECPAYKNPKENMKYIETGDLPEDFPNFCDSVLEKDLNKKSCPMYGIFKILTHAGDSLRDISDRMNKMLKRMDASLEQIDDYHKQFDETMARMHEKLGNYDDAIKLVEDADLSFNDENEEN